MTDEKDPASKGRGRKSRSGRGNSTCKLFAMGKNLDHLRCSINTSVLGVQGTQGTVTLMGQADYSKDIRFYAEMTEGSVSDLIHIVKIRICFSKLVINVE